MEHANSDIVSCIDGELAGSKFSDERLGKRLRKLVVQLDARMGEPLPFACGDWANTKAAYRFLSNGDVSEREILAGHFTSTKERIAAADGPILVLQDTTEFVFKRGAPQDIGAITYAPLSLGTRGPRKQHTVCGLLMHSSLAITPEGLPLGLAAIKFWTRTQFNGTTARKRHINPTREPISGKESIRWLENMEHATVLAGDPARCVHIGDRENDIYEFYCKAEEIGTHFIVRECNDRCAGDGDHRVSAEMAEVAVQGLHTVEVRTKSGDIEHVIVELKYKKIQMIAPIAKRKRYPAVGVTVIYAIEKNAPTHRPPIVWRLITNLTIETNDDAIEKLHWYARRWKIEVFHKILKSGCRVEDARLRTADRLVNLIAIFCLLSWRNFWMTMMNRFAPTAPAALVLTPEECAILDEIVPNRKDPMGADNSLGRYLTKIAQLGGYLARSHDPPPGNIVMWRGWHRLMDISVGLNLHPKLVGN